MRKGEVITNRLLEPEIVDALRSFDSPTISNAIETFEVRERTKGYASMELRCQFPDPKPMIGYAVTCKANSTSLEPNLQDRLNDLLDLIAAAPKPAVVVMQQHGPDRLRSCFVGDMIASACQKLGAVGIVTDGGLRDLSGIRRRAPGFQVFAPGAVVSHGDAIIFEVNVPVSVCGMDIDPGDLLHGDESGLLQVPMEIARPLVARARLISEDEKAIFEFLNSDSFSLEELKRRFSH